jgi:hypothetical protein
MAEAISPASHPRLDFSPERPSSLTQSISEATSNATGPALESSPNGQNHFADTTGLVNYDRYMGPRDAEIFMDVDSQNWIGSPIKEPRTEGYSKRWYSEKSDSSGCASSDLLYLPPSDDNWIHGSELAVDEEPIQALDWTPGSEWSQSMPHDSQSFGFNFSYLGRFPIQKTKLKLFRTNPLQPI